MMSISARGVALIAKYEGFSPQPYFCPAGYRTIGYGHVLLPEEAMEEISEAAARQLLLADAQIAEQSVRRLIHVPLTQNQFDALVSFTFNVGGGALQRSTLRACVNRGEHEAAAMEFGRWVRASGKIMKGLQARRQEEASLYVLYKSVIKT